MANEFKAKNGVITPVLQSTVATGTAPLTVTSTTRVANLNVATAGTADTATTATSAATLTTARTIALTGDVTYTSGAFNGSGNVTGTATLATVNSNIGTFNSVTVNGKGLVTSASNVGYLTAEADTLATVTARGAVATASLTIGTGGGYVAGSIYSDASWGMIFRAKQASPTQAEYRWANSADTELMRLTTGGNLTIPGAFAAASKSFLIPHPTKEGKKLRYGSLEGPENGVYIRGKLKDNNTIELPEYWTKLVDPDSITVSLTPIGKHQDLYVENIADNKVIVGNGNLINKNINCFFVVYGERVDIAKLVVESE